MITHAKRELLIAVVVVAALTVHTLSTVGLNMPLDLTVYLRGGQAVIDGSDRVYDTPFGLLPFTYPPLAAVVFTVFAVLPPVLTTIVVAAASFASLYLLVLISHGNIPPLARIHPAFFMLPLGFIEPVTATIDYGQVNLILAAAIIVDLLWVGPRRSGILLGIAICIKVTPAIFLLLPLLRKDWATLRRAVITAALGTLLPLLVMPDSWVYFWFHALWDPQRVGGVAYLGNQSIQGAIWRLLGPGGRPILTYVLDAAVLAASMYAASRFGRSDPLAAVLSIAIAGLLISPISWSHHWVWVAPLIMWHLSQALRGHRWPASSAMKSANADALAPALRWASGLLALVWFVATYRKILWAAPAGGDVEYTVSLPLKLLSDAYPILGLLSLIVLTLIARTVSSSAFAHRAPAHDDLKPHSPATSSNAEAAQREQPRTWQERLRHLVSHGKATERSDR